MCLPKVFFVLLTGFDLFLCVGEWVCTGRSPLSTNCILSSSPKIRIGFRGTLCQFHRKLRSEEGLYHKKEEGFRIGKDKHKVHLSDILKIHGFVFKVYKLFKVFVLKTVKLTNFWSVNSLWTLMSVCWLVGWTVGAFVRRFVCHNFLKI